MGLSPKSGICVACTEIGGSCTEGTGGVGIGHDCSIGCV